MVIHKKRNSSLSDHASKGNREWGSGCSIPRGLSALFSIRPSAELSPSSIPSVLNSAFLSELSSSQAGRDCRQTDPQFSSPEASQSLQRSIQEIFEDGDAEGKANIPGIPRESPEDVVDAICFGGNVCGRGVSFHQGRQMMEPGDQRYGSLGGVHSGSVWPERAGAKQVLGTSWDGSSR